MTGSDSADGEELGDAVMVGGVDGDSRSTDVLFELGEGCGADDNAGDLIGAPFAGAPVGGPAAAHDIVHGFHGFPEFGFRVVAVAVEYVHVFEFEAFKAAFDGIDDVFAAEAFVGGMIGHGPEYFGGHDVGTPVVSGKNGAQEGFGGSPFVDVGGVDVVDAQFQGPGDDFLGLIQFNLVGECEPGAVGDFAYGESAMLYAMCVDNIREVIYGD